MNTCAQHTAIFQTWTETERGWGQKPWGNTLHLTKEDMSQYNSAFWSSMPDRGPGGSVPDWYIYPNAEARELQISEELYQELLAQKKDTSLSNEFDGRGIHCRNPKTCVTLD